MYLVASGALAEDRYPPATFGDLHEGSLNISVFTFRDLERNGRYDWVICGGQPAR
jgi:hypothetical protein